MDEVIQQLHECIETGQWPVGERVPGERELSVRLGVARGSVREAIRSLEGMGLVEVLPGKGCFVTSTSAQSYLAQQWSDWIRERREALRHLLEVREAVEAKAAELAAREGDPAGLDGMEQAIAALAGALQDGDLAAAVRADLDFHVSLARASRNRVLEDLSQALNQVIEHDREALLALPGRAQHSLRQHRGILDAIRAGRADLARRRILTHFADVLRDVTRRD